MPSEEEKGLGAIVELAGAAAVVDKGKASNGTGNDKDRMPEIGTTEQQIGELEGYAAHEIDSDPRNQIQRVEAEAVIPAEIDSHPNHHLIPMELPANIPAVMPDQIRPAPQVEPVAVQENSSQVAVAATAPTPQGLSELEELRRKQMELEKEQQYITRMQEIEMESARLQQRIGELEKQSSVSP
jgi:hypothetical protein